MADAKQMQLAKDTFATMCRMLDNNDWNYKKDEENLRVECGARGEDLPMDLHIRVDADRQVISVISLLPVTFAEDKRVDGAVAIAMINRQIINGFFGYDVAKGHVFFRLPNSFMGSLLSEEAMRYLVYLACGAIDDYNDKLLMLAKGMISIEQFMESINQ